MLYISSCDVYGENRTDTEYLEENDYEMLFVINKHRFMTGTPEGTIEIMKEIEDACGLKFTGIVNKICFTILLMVN